jgi:4-amino-4-deoxy-L-arabinose transferase-like glycosyltransferase
MTAGLQRRRTEWFVLWGLLIVAIGLFFYRLGERDLWSSHEARAAMDAESLLRADSNGLPRLHDGRMELQKPPLYYWCVAGIAWLANGVVDGLAVRLPATVSAVAVLLVVGLGVGVGFRRPVAGLLAALVLSTGIHFPWMARIGRIDMPLTCTVTLAGMAFALALTRPDPNATRTRRLLVIAYLACALGVLLKGPIGLVLPGGIVAGILLAQGRWPAIWEGRAWWRLLGELRIGHGVVLILFISMPMFVWLEYASEGQFLREFFWHHNLERGLGGSRLRSHPLGHYPGYLVLYLLPWSLLLIIAWPRFWRDDPLARLGLAWLVGIVVVLSAARFKRADYLLPAYPGAAVFLACFLERLLASARRRLALAGIVGVASLMLLGWGYRLGWSLPAEEAYRNYRPFAEMVRRQAPAPCSIIFFRAEAHALAFRVGQPLVQVVQWPHLQQCVDRPGDHWLIMPPAVVPEARIILAGVELDEIADTASLAGGAHERPLTLLRARQTRQPIALNTE